MGNEATKRNYGQLALFTGGELVEDLIYEFLKDRSPLTERAYQRDLKAFFEFTATQFGLPRSAKGKLLFEEIRRVHVVKYKKYLDDYLSNRKRAYAPNTAYFGHAEQMFRLDGERLIRSMPNGPSERSDAVVASANVRLNLLATRIKMGL